MQRELVTVQRFYTQQASALELKLLAGANGLKRLIREPTVNRPGLALAGFTKYFASKRVQVIGAADCQSAFGSGACTGRADAIGPQDAILPHKLLDIHFASGYLTKMNSFELKIT